MSEMGRVCSPHDWRKAPGATDLSGKVEAVCVTCLTLTRVPADTPYPVWTDEDYYRDRERIEATFGPGWDAVLSGVLSAPARNDR